MIPGRVYDWSFATLTLDQLLEVEPAGWVRYIASDRRKTITPAELGRLHGAGLPGALVHEETASWHSWNSTLANQLADGLGWPADRPIYYAADSDLPPGDYATVADTLAHMDGRPRGIYGESGLVQHCLDAGAAAFGWITNAGGWSKVPAPGACLQQLYGQSTIPGTDANIVLADDWGQWPIAAAPLPPPPPKIEEPEMLVLQRPNSDYLLHSGRIVAVADALPPSVPRLACSDRSWQLLTTAFGAPVQ